MENLNADEISVLKILLKEVIRHVKPDERGDLLRGEIVVTDSEMSELKSMLSKIQPNK